MNIHRQNRTDNIIFLFGPTAVGKTDLLCSLFSSGYEVVNADSVQVYRKLDIGSAKASQKEQSCIPHHLIDILEPNESYNVASFISLADKACKEIWSRGNIPVLCGGTAFYFKHFLFGLSDAPKADEKTREEVSSWIKEAGLEEAHRYLCSIDPVSGERINPNDSYRVSRAIEVYKASGKPLSSFTVPTTPRNNMKPLIIGLTRDRDEMRARIAKRVDIMFEEGIVDEIKSLVSSGADLSWQSMQGIGYSEFLKAAEKCGGLDFIDLEEVKKQIVMDSIHYAKRQMTFFRSFADAHWFNPADVDSIRDLLESTYGSSPSCH